MPPETRESPYRRGRFDLHAWRERTRQRLTSRFGLRVHMTLLVALVFATAFLTTRILLGLGVGSMGVRYLVAALAGYSAFFGLLRVWLWYATEGAQLDPEHSPDSVAHAIDPDAAAKGERPKERIEDHVTLDVPTGDIPIPIGGGSSGGGGGGSSGGGGLGLDIDGDGLVAVLLIALVCIVAVVLFGAAGYVIYQAPTLLGEAAVELVLASVLARSSLNVTRGDWSGSVFTSTWKPALLLLAVVTLAGFAAQGLCPGPTTLPGVLKQCVVDRDKS